MSKSETVSLPKPFAPNVADLTSSAKRSDGQGIGSRSTMLLMLLLLLVLLLQRQLSSCGCGQR